MNLEDRLRSHLHSGQDLFDESSVAADDITKAGIRRTRRNQMALGAAAGFTVLAAVFGVSAIGQLNPTQDVANEVLLTEESGIDDQVAGETSEDTAQTDAIDDQLEDSTDSSSSDEASTQVFDGPIPAFDIVAGTGNGFAGLRNTDGVFSAIRSDDGLTWNEGPTDFPDGVDVMSLVEDDGVFVAIAGSFDDTGRAQQWIASSNDLEKWDLVEVETPTDSEVFVGSLDVHDGIVVAGVTAFSTESAEDEESGTFGEASEFVLRGPVGGPFELIDAQLPGRILSVARANGTSLLWVDSDQSPSSVFVSTDAEQTWSEIVSPSELQTVGIATVGNQVVWLGTPGGGLGNPEPPLEAFVLADGVRWEAVGLPVDIANTGWWSVLPQTSGDTVVVSLSGTTENPNERFSALMVSTGGDFTEIDLTAQMTAIEIENAMLVATNDEEALFQFFGVPLNDPGSENNADDESLPRYIRIPLR